MARPSIAVVVIGDLGRSPRMQYHALSIADQSGYDVDLIGYSGSSPCERLVNNPRIRIHTIEEVKYPNWMNSYLLRSVYKTMIQLWQLIWLMLWEIHRPTYILCQNPPAIPLLAVAVIVSIFRGSKFVIDWHNYGYTWLSVNRPGSPLLVSIYRIYEKFFGKLACAAFCVSNAMKTDLSLQWGISAHTLHDLPQPFFQRTSPTIQYDLFNRHSFGILQTTKSQENAFFASPDTPRPQRPILMVSSTSWTADEDFSVLLDAVTSCDRMITQNLTKFPYSPSIRFVVTGKGDLREYYEQRILELKLSHFTFYTEFLTFADYAKLLGSADFGVSLHFSSSKLDLPMKVVDMFGSELPVIAYDYGCLSELVQNGKNGFTFTNKEQLADILFRNILSLTKDPNAFEDLRHNIRQFKKKTWSEQWEATALPVFGRVDSDDHQIVQDIDQAQDTNDSQTPSGGAPANSKSKKSPKGSKPRVASKKR